MNDTGASGAVQATSAVVVGASSQIGHYLLPSLSSAGLPVFAMSRLQRGGAGVVRWFVGDLGACVHWPVISRESVLFHLAHLSLLPDHIEALASRNVRRIVAFSSTGRFSKAQSDSPKERALASNLALAEERFISNCESSGVQWTLFRPTMIYSGGMDRNVSFIALMARTCRFFPLAGKGSGLRQPVHAEDLAAACMAVFGNSATYGKTYTLSGGEILRYRELVERVFLGLRITPRIVVVPVSVLRTIIRMIRLVPRFRYLTPEMAGRMNTDMCFDHARAAEDFGFSPRRRFVYGQA